MFWFLMILQSQPKSITFLEEEDAGGKRETHTDGFSAFHGGMGPTCNFVKFAGDRWAVPPTWRSSGSSGSHF